MPNYVVSRMMWIYYENTKELTPYNIFILLYLSLNLATTLSCTLLIIYRILTVAGVRCGAEGQLQVYQCFIEVLVESSALYSLSLILILAFTVSNKPWGQCYFEVVGAVVKVRS